MRQRRRRRRLQTWAFRIKNIVIVIVIIIIIVIVTEMRRSALHWRLCIALLLLCAVVTCLLSLFFGIPPSAQHDRFMEMMQRRMYGGGGSLASFSFEAANGNNNNQNSASDPRASVHKPLARTPEQLLRDIGIVASSPMPSFAAAAAAADNKRRPQQQQYRPTPAAIAITKTTTTMSVDQPEPVSLPLPAEHHLSAKEQRNRAHRGCLQTAESPLYITDDLGRTCLRQDTLDTGCCDTRNASRVAFLSCYTCSVDRQVRVDMSALVTDNNNDRASTIHRRCCEHFELCVSCCMRHSTDATHYDSHELMADAYKRCKTWCRTNGDSVFDEEHQHFVRGYAVAQHRFCFLHIHGDTAAHLSVVNHHLVSSMLRRQVLEAPAKQHRRRHSIYQRVPVERETAASTTSTSLAPAPPSPNQPSPSRRMDFGRL